MDRVNKININMEKMMEEIKANFDLRIGKLMKFAVCLDYLESEEEIEMFKKIAERIIKIDK